MKVTDFAAHQPMAPAGAPPESFSLQNSLYCTACWSSPLVVKSNAPDFPPVASSQFMINCRCGLGLFKSRSVHSSPTEKYGAVRVLYEPTYEPLYPFT